MADLCTKIRLYAKANGVNSVDFLSALKTLSLKRFKSDLNIFSQFG